MTLSALSSRCQLGIFAGILSFYVENSCLSNKRLVRNKRPVQTMKERRSRFHEREVSAALIFNHERKKSAALSIS